MSKATVQAGICGFRTEIGIVPQGPGCSVSLESDCPHMTQLAEKLKTVDPFTEITFQGDGPSTLRAASECLPHPACPVPVGIIKAIEVEFGLALPADVAISITGS